MRGKRIRSLKELEKASVNKKAVTCTGTNFKCVPAAVMLNMQGRLLLRLLDRGMFIYKIPIRKPGYGQ